MNFSAWRSDEDAQRWYHKSEAHRAILQAHRGGSPGGGGNNGLSSFGALLSRLTADEESRPLRWHARCDNCRSIVKDYPDVQTCHACGEVVDYMPII